MIKNKIYKGLTKTAIAAILVGSLVTPLSTKAAEHDLYKGNTNQGGIFDFILDNNKFYDLFINISAYKYELDGKLYTATKINEIFTANPGMAQADIAQKVQEAGLVGTPISSLTVSGVYTGGLMSYVDVAMNQFTSNIDKVYVDGVELSKTQYSFVNNGSTLRIVQVTKASQVQVKLVGQNDKIQVVF